MSNVHLRKLCITRGNNEIIRDLDLEIAPGEFLVLLGPSGCGKSTLLHSIAGLIDVSGGAIEIAHGSFNIVSSRRGQQSQVESGCLDLA
mgnify:CR=1 FL=1